MREKIKTMRFSAKVKAIQRSLKTLLRRALRTAKHLTKRTHHHIAHKPHQHLVEKVSWYRRWHEHQFHSHVHFSVLVVYAFIVGATVLFFQQQAFAASTVRSWDFTVAGDYTFDDTQVEVTGDEARLKVQNYVSDANTVGLWHFDEATGTIALDASANVNNGQIQGNASLRLAV